MCSYHLHRRAQAKASHTHAQAKASDAYAQAKASAEPRRGGGAMRDDHGKIGLRALSSTAATLRRPHYYIATLVVAAMLGRAASDNFIRGESTWAALTVAGFWHSEQKTGREVRQLAPDALAAYKEVQRIHNNRLALVRHAKKLYDKGAFSVLALPQASQKSMRIPVYRPAPPGRATLFEGLYSFFVKNAFQFKGDVPFHLLVSQAEHIAHGLVQKQEKEAGDRLQRERLPVSRDDVSKVVSKWLDEYGLSTRVKTDKKTVSYEEGRRRSGCFWRNSIRIRWYFHPAEFQFDAYDHTPVTRNMSAETTVAVKGSQVVAPSENHREKKDRHTLLLFSSSDKRRIAPEVCFKGSNISNIASPEASELPVAVPPY